MLACLRDRALRPIGASAGFEHAASIIIIIIIIIICYDDDTCMRASAGFASRGPASILGRIRLIFCSWSFIFLLVARFRFSATRVAQHPSWAELPISQMMLIPRPVSRGRGGEMEGGREGCWVADERLEELVFGV